MPKPEMPSGVRLGELMALAVGAHDAHAREERDKIRFFDGETPYGIHPAWCAMTLMFEPKLSREIRIYGGQALLFHDVLEDTSASLPEDLPPEVVRLVKEMTFDSFAVEEETIWQKEDVIKLLKLYDKVSTLLDCDAWMKPESLSEYKKYVIHLTDEVERIYGDLKIIQIARLLAGGAESFIMDGH